MLLIAQSEVSIETASQAFSFADWAVVGVYGLILIVSGIYFNRKEQKDTSDYFLGGHSMPAWAVAVSIMATTLSAATFIGVPDISFKSDWRYLLFQLGAIIAVITVAIAFIPVFYKANVTTIYELLGQTFGSSTQTTAGWMFMVGRVFASGARAGRNRTLARRGSYDSAVIFTGIIEIPAHNWESPEIGPARGPEVG